MQHKKLPLVAVIGLDVLLFACILSTFCYFHHIRLLWFGSEQVPDVIESFSKPEESRPTVSEEESKGGDIPLPPDISDTEPATPTPDRSGDFGKAWGDKFLYTDAPAVRLQENGEIRSYCEEQSLPCDGTGVYIRLYRSHDLFLTVEQRELPVGASRAVYYVFDLYIRNIENLFTQTVPNRQPFRELIDAGAEYAGGPVIAAINGDYTGNINHCLIAERNGELLRKTDYLSSDICVLYYDGRMETVSPEAYDWEKIRSGVPYQIWNFGPGLLTADGKAIREFDASAYDQSVISARHPRAAIGYYAPGHYCFVSGDGRSDSSLGTRIPELAQIFEDLGCLQAYNFDGGDSAQSYFDGSMIRTSSREDGKTRNLYDIVCIGEVAP